VLQDAGYLNTNGEPWGKSADGCVVMRLLYRNGVWPTSAKNAVLKKRDEKEVKAQAFVKAVVTPAAPATAAAPTAAAAAGAAGASSESGEELGEIGELEEVLGAVVEM